MKKLQRLRCSLGDKRGVNGDCMREHDKGRYVDITDKQLLIHALMGCTAPYDRPNMVTLGIIEFKGNQHDCYKYGWVREVLDTIHLDDLIDMYEAFKK